MVCTALKYFGLTVPYAVAGTAAQSGGEHERDDKRLHYSGDAVASGVGEAAGGDGRFGAVVLSGVNEAGGGSDSSYSGGGSGATSPGEVCIREDEPPEEPGGPAAAVVVALGFFAVAAVSSAGCSAPSPTFARNCSTRFLARSPAVEPGC